MLASQLRDRIAVYAENTPANAANKRNRNYSFAFNDRAAISFDSGSHEFSTATEMQAKKNKFKVRFALNRYNETMVILWRNDYYTIESIDADQRRTYLIITATRAMRGIIEIVE